MFPHIFYSNDEEELKFVPKETDGNLKDVLRKPPIGKKDFILICNKCNLSNVF